MGECQIKIGTFLFCKINGIPFFFLGGDHDPPFHSCNDSGTKVLQFHYYFIPLPSWPDKIVLWLKLNDLYTCYDKLWLTKQFLELCVTNVFFSCRLAGKLWLAILLLSFSAVYPLASYVCEWHNFFDQSYMFDLFKLFQTRSSEIKLIQSCSYFLKTCSNLFKLV